MPHDSTGLVVQDRDGVQMLLVAIATGRAIVDDWAGRRSAYDWTVRLATIAAAAEQIKAKSFTIDGEAVVIGPDGLSLFERLRRREAARTAILVVV